jgi:hypothetical protein
VRDGAWTSHVVSLASTLHNFERSQLLAIIMVCGLHDNAREEGMPPFTST